MRNSGSRSSWREKSWQNRLELSLDRALDRVGRTVQADLEWNKLTAPRTIPQRNRTVPTRLRSLLPFTMVRKDYQVWISRTFLRLLHAQLRMCRHVRCARKYGSMEGFGSTQIPSHLAALSAVWLADTDPILIRAHSCSLALIDERTRQLFISEIKWFFLKFQDSIFVMLTAK